MAKNIFARTFFAVKNSMIISRCTRRGRGRGYGRGYGRGEGEGEGEGERERGREEARERGREGERERGRKCDYLLYVLHFPKVHCVLYFYFVRIVLQ